MSTAAKAASAVDPGVDILQGMENALAYARGDESKGRAHAVEVPAVDEGRAREARPVAGQVRHRLRRER